MQNQPTTGHPWFRLASITRMASLQPSTQAPDPTAAPVELSRDPSVRPQAPPPQPPTQMPQPVPQQPQIPPPLANGAAAQKVGSTPPQSPKVIRQSTPTPPATPRIQHLQKSIATLTPHPEPEPQKPLLAPQPNTVFMLGGNGNGSTTKAMGNSSAEPQTNGQSQINKKAPPPSPRRETMSSAAFAAKKKDDDDQMRMLTMAGENIGAYMELGSPYRYHHQLNRKSPHQGKEGESWSEEGKIWDKKEMGKKEATAGKPIAAMVNSNVQSVNNSILFSSSCTQHSPGVHVALKSHRRPKEATGDDHHLL